MAHWECISVNGNTILLYGEHVYLMVSTNTLCNEGVNMCAVVAKGVS